jgi:hypothetical protein
MFESVGGGLGQFAVWAWGWAVKGGTVIAVLWFCKHALQVLLAGGNGREAWRAVVGVFVIAVALAALKNMDATLGLVAEVGQRAYDFGLAELRTGLRS